MVDALHPTPEPAPVREPALVEAETVVDQAEQASKKPEGILARELSRFRNELGGWRKAAIQAMPGFLVNYSSNILGAMHIGTEIVMLKASAAKSDGQLIKNKSNLFNYVREPLESLWVDTYKGSKPQTSVGSFFKGNPFTNFKEYLDPANANKLEEPLAKKNGFKAYANRWQMRSTLAGVVVWTLSTLIPDKKEDPKEVERMAELQQRSPLGYIGERLRQAVWIPEWAQHKRQMIGLGVMVSGISSILGSWRQRGTVAGQQIYTFDGSYLMQSFFTFASATALLFSLDDERGYSRFGLGMIGRLTFLPKTISNKFARKEPGAEWYTLGTLGFQLENMAQGLIGGAEKNPDGTIIDHAAVRQDAKLKAKVKGAARTLGEPMTEDELNQRVEKLKHMRPSNMVSAVTEREQAMPERVAAHEAGQANREATAAMA